MCHRFNGTGKKLQYVSVLHPAFDIGQTTLTIKCILGQTKVTLQAFHCEKSYLKVQISFFALKVLHSGFLECLLTFADVVCKFLGKCDNDNAAWYLR